MAFRPRSEHELNSLSDDELIAYIRDARVEGALAEGRLALQILVFGHWDIVAARLRMKLPAHAVEDTAGEVIASAITSSFAGESVGEFKVLAQHDPAPQDRRLLPRAGANDRGRAPRG